MEQISYRSLALHAILALICGFGGATLWSWSGLSHTHTRAYLLENPDILPEMIANYEKQQAREQLAQLAGNVFEPFPGAILGNPNGSVTVVEFTDYGCSFCRMSQKHVQTLITKNPDLRVVIREWPIFEGSDKAAKMALAAAKQGKFAAFHRAMFAQASLTEANIMAAAQTAQLNLEQAQAFVISPDANLELSKNIAFAKQLGFSGTPSWIVGDEIFEGAVGVEKLQDAIDAARTS